MLQNATRLADVNLTPLGSILQAAAGRAWVRTRPVRTHNRGFATESGGAVALKCRISGEASRGTNLRTGVGMR